MTHGVTVPQPGRNAAANAGSVGTHTPGLPAPGSVYGNCADAEPLSQAQRARWFKSMAVVVGALIVAGGWTWLRLRRSPAPEYVQLTNYADSVTSPALSPDGRMPVFLRGADTFRGPGEVYVKLLPDGPPFQLTHDGVAKMSPVFSPDGARIAYTTLLAATGDVTRGLAPVLRP